MASLLSPMALAWLLVLFSTLILYTVLQLTAASRRRRRQRLPPGPWPLPLVGNLLAIGRSNPHHSLARLAERYGPVMSIRVGAPLQAVVVSSPSAARDLHQLGRRNAGGLAGRPVLDAWRGGPHIANSVFALPPCPRWRAMRRLSVSKMLSPRRLDALRPVRQEEARALVRRVATERARGGGEAAVIEVREAVFAASLRILWRTMFSSRLDDDGMLSELGSIVREGSFLTGAPNVSDVLPAVVAAADVQGLRRRMEEVVAKAYRIIDDLLARRKACHDSGEPRNDDLLDAALDDEQGRQAEGGDPVLNRDAIKGLITDLYVAGTESTSATIEWAMAELLRSPTSMKKVKEEFMRVLGSKTHVNETDIDQLPYLQAVVKETLRLHPAAPLVLYRAEGEAEIQGYTIPKGTTIILNLWALHRQPDVWVDPAKFVPDRFMGKHVNFFGSYPELIPFSAGQRICLGLPLAIRSLHLILASLLYHFDWKLLEGTNEDVDMAENLHGLVATMATPLKTIVA